MYPEKKVKALEEENNFAPMLVKATPVYSIYDLENSLAIEYIVRYDLDNIVIEDLNRLEYFLISRLDGYNYLHTIFQRGTGRFSYEIEDIETYDDSTTIYIRLSVPKFALIETYGELNINRFIGEDSAFYVYYDMSNLYDEGFNTGYIEGTKESSKFPSLLRNAFEGVGGFLGIELLPGISIGAIIAIPIVFGVIAFILGRRRG